ncbi:FadR/GntR family transcriptional regulator [Rhodoferax sp.]|uniref:FadR/GntR family transcriptional regulator n=1 Tax=Rhodoferax sp. TaxID=50421 RepID=UPI0025F9DEC4|nr:FadR/GntR family transcriptional regulator [Rhodoferax sp.]
MNKTERLTQLFGKRITQGDYAPGVALPSEADLCEQFGVSRNVIREVVKVLATKRLIDAQRNRGLFVMPAERWNYLDVDVLEWTLEKGSHPSLIRSLIEVWGLIEPIISRWAAERATAVDLVEIEASFNAMAANPSRIDVFHEADIRFHRAVLIASHNVVMQQLSDAVSALQRAIFDVTFVSDTAHMALTIQEHRELFEAIRRKLPDAAEAVSRQMIERTAQRAFSGMDRDGGKVGTRAPDTEMDS